MSKRPNTTEFPAIGELVDVPSGLGGSFSIRVKEIDFDAGSITGAIENTQYPDWHGQLHTAELSKAKRIKP